MQHALGVDIGGSSAKIGIVNDRGEMVIDSLLTTPVGSPQQVAAGYVAAVERILNQSRKKGMRINGIGIGLPGHLREDRKASQYSNVHILDDFPVVDFFSQRFRHPILLDNDATLAALAEQKYGAGKESVRLLVMTVGTGIGAGLIVNGVPQRSVRGCIGDPGHIIVEPASVHRCGYGCKGCLETVASGKAIEREAATLAQQNPNSPLAKRLQTNSKLTTSAVIHLSKTRDQLALQIIEKVGGWLGMALASWCTIYDPDTILIGGGVSAAGDALLKPLKRAFGEYGAPIYVSNPNISFAQLGNKAGVIGAAGLFL